MAWAPAGLFQGGANPEANQWLKANLPGVYFGTPIAPDVLFHSVEKRLAVFLCQTLCNSVHRYWSEKTEMQNPGGCKCTTLHLPAGALVSHNNNNNNNNNS